MTEPVTLLLVEELREEVDSTSVLAKSEKDRSDEETDLVQEL